MKRVALDLVDAVIAACQADGGRVCLDPCDEPAPALPVPEDRLADLTLPGGRRLPPSLKRWLAFDGRAVKLFRSVPNATWRAPLKIGRLCKKEFDEALAGFEAVLPEECYLIPGGTEQRRLLYVGKADADGEYPIFTVDPTGVPMLALSAPSFGVYLAQLTGVLPEPVNMEANFDNEGFKAAMRAQARLNFHGWSSAELASHGNGIDGKEKPWPASKKPTPAKG